MPVTLTTAQASQDALNIAGSIQITAQTGASEDVYDLIGDLAAAVALLAQIINVNASSLGATISPTSVSIGTQYSQVLPATLAIRTIQR
jgi:hypothetical protein